MAVAQFSYMKYKYYYYYTLLWCGVLIHNLHRIQFWPKWPIILHEILLLLLCFGVMFRLIIDTGYSFGQQQNIACRFARLNNPNNLQHTLCLGIILVCDCLYSLICPQEDTKSARGFVHRPTGRSTFQPDVMPSVSPTSPSPMSVKTIGVCENNYILKDTHKSVTFPDAFSSMKNEK